MEDRISAIEQVLGTVSTTLGKKLDEHTLRLDGIRNQLDEQEITLYEHTAILRAHSKDLRELKLRTAAVETRLNTIDEKLEKILALLSPRQAEE